jgi:BlaI family transcriptional regulator, penicillinase repressor
MARTPLSRPTDGELAILRVLWERGPSTVREIHQVISDRRSAAYTTTLKLLQIMTEKGLTTREEWGRVHRYTAAAPQEETQRQLVEDLVERAFGGSAGKLMVQALATKRASPEELAEIRTLLDKRRGGTR